ncbi:MAG: hypothetical protein V4536_08630 [Pseudomonadota bacterium]
MIARPITAGRSYLVAHGGVSQVVIASNPIDALLIVMRGGK